MIESVADLVHQQWATWMIYLFNTCKHNPDGSVTIPKEKVARWQRQMNTPYEWLSDTEKRSDRKFAKRYLAVIGDAQVRKDVPEEYAWNEPE